MQCMGLHDAVVRAGWTQPLGYIVICLQHVQWSGLGKHGCLWTHIEFSALLVWVKAVLAKERNSQCRRISIDIIIHCTLVLLVRESSGFVFLKVNNKLLFRP